VLGIELAAEDRDVDEQLGSGPHPTPPNASAAASARARALFPKGRAQPAALDSNGRSSGESCISWMLSNPFPCA
jgi:hypothetical protein